MNREEHIWKGVKNHWNYLKKMYPQYNVIYLGLQGSQNYNVDMYTEDYTSDIDTKAIIVPTLEDIAYNRTPISETIVLPNNEHIDVKDVRTIFNCFMKQNIQYLEILFTKYRIINLKYKPYILKLLEMNEDIANMDRTRLLNHIYGVSMEKRKDLCHEYEGLKEKIHKYGYDGKQLHHIIRLNQFLLDTLTNIPMSKVFDFKSNAVPEIYSMAIKSKLSSYGVEEACQMADAFLENTRELKDKAFTENKYEVNEQTKQNLYGLQYMIIRAALEEDIIPHPQFGESKSKSVINPNYYNRVWITSDLHLGHKNILEMEPDRASFLDIDVIEDRDVMIKQHDEKLISNWNKRIGPNDLVYILGDLSFHNGKKTNEIVKQLNGEKVLIKGNHENIWMDNNADLSLFAEIEDYKEITYKGEFIVLSHYPIQLWNRMHRDSILLFGHTHSLGTTLITTNKYKPNSANVGIDINKGFPISLEEAIRLAEEGVDL